MTFEEWALINKFPSENCALVATKAAWDYQQRLIDEQQKEIAHWRAKCILLQDKIDEYGGCLEILEKLDAKEYGDDEH